MVPRPRATGATWALAIPELVGRGVRLRGRDPLPAVSTDAPMASAIAEPQVNRLKFMISRLSRLGQNPMINNNPRRL